MDEFEEFREECIGGNVSATALALLADYYYNEKDEAEKWKCLKFWQEKWLTLRDNWIAMGLKTSNPANERIPHPAPPILPNVKKKTKKIQQMLSKKEIKKKTEELIKEGKIKNVRGTKCKPKRLSARRKIRHS